MPQKTLLAAIIILLGNVIFGYFIYQNNKNRLSSEHWVLHTMEVQYQAKKIIASEKHMSTLLNAYQFDGMKAFKPSIDTTISEIKAGVDSLTTLTKDNKLQQGRSILLNKYLTSFFNEIASLNYTNDNRLRITSAIVITEKRFANQVNYLIGAILKEEGKLLAKRKEDYRNNVTEFTWFSIYMFMAISIFTILLLLATRKIFMQSDEKNQRADELSIANKTLSLEKLLKQKKAGELILATKELFFQKREKSKRAAELVIANKELSFQNDEKGKRAAELISANIELSFQNKEKEKRANELSLANTELSFQNKEKEKRALELKEVIQRLNKSELFSRGILNSLSSHIGVMDYSGKLIAVNESWSSFAIENKHTTLSRIPIGNNYFDECNQAIKNGDLISAIALQGIKDVMEKKKPFFYLEYPCHSLTDERWFGMRAIKFDSEDNMVVVSHLNITERKLAENNLSVSESRLKEAQAIAHIGNFEMNLVEKFDIWSDEMYQILGLEKAELAPSVKQFLRFIHPNDLKKTRKDIEEVFNNFTFKSVEFRFYKKDGTLRYGYCQSQFELDNTGRPIRLFGIFQDVTNSKLAELERTKMVKDLVQRNKDLEQFGYIVSHNLRAPVANIIGATTILGDQSLSKPDKAMLRSAINTSVSKLDDVIKDLNHILQVKTGLSERQEMVSFEELVNDIKSSIKTLLSENSITINYNFNEIDEIATLKPYLYSIFFNLITNSIKYRKENLPLLIQVKSKKLEKGVELSFTDNGMGIDLARHGHDVFGLYKRFHEQIDGKGMGLYMVKIQTEALGGTVSVFSQENQGTTFIVKIF